MIRNFFVHPTVVPLLLVLCFGRAVEEFHGGSTPSHVKVFVKIRIMEDPVLRTILQNRFGSNTKPVFISSFIYSSSRLSYALIIL